MKSLLCLLALGLSAHAGEWRLVWSDDFNQPGAPDSTKWTYEKGFMRNEELQYYTVNRSENARVENGCLVIEARHEATPNAAFKEGSQSWMTNRKDAAFSSASLTTQKLKAFHYGKIEVRAKLPQGKGVWPAIWMIGANQGGRWPMCGEIDIMEFVSHDPGKVHATIHFAKPGTTAQQINGSTRSETLHSDFHIHGLGSE